MTSSNTTLPEKDPPAQRPEVDEKYLESLSEGERDRLILEQLERVDLALASLSPELKVLMALKAAASWAITCGTKVDDFLHVAKDIWKDTEEDVADFALELAASGVEIPEAETAP